MPEFIGLYKKQCVIPCYHTLAIPGIIYRICFPGSFFSATSCVLLLRPNILSSFFPLLQPFPQYFGVRNSGRRRTLHFLGTAHTSHRNMPKKKLRCGRSWRTRKRPDARQSFAPPQLLIPTVFFLKVIARNEAAHLEQEACQRHTPLNLWER